MSKRALLLPGDGIGPEVMAAVEQVIAVLNTRYGLGLETASGAVGGASLDARGVPLSDDVLSQARASDVVLMGAVGGPQWEGVAYHLRPEQGLLDLRKGLGLFANLRPAFCFSALADASSLKREHVEGLDLIFVRELIGGVYFGTPRGIEDLPDGQKRGVNTQSYTTSEIERVARTAFELARQRRGAVCSVDKANVMESGLLWRQTVTELGQSEYPDVALSHMYADNCAMQLARAPKQFDVILTDNLFGDILSDEAAMLTGSLGMLPSAALGEPGRPGLYEPIHGSAPDIAGKGVANPCAAILSLAMALRLQLERPDLAGRVEAAIAAVLDAGLRTPDLHAGPGTQLTGTQGLADAVTEHLAG
ncbi:MAG: 3-isopropylmalate dehydrogenase [Glycocaulis sp.]